MNNAKIIKIEESVVVLDGMIDANIYDVVYVGEKKLIGEIFKIEDDKAFVAMLDDMSGLQVGDEAEKTNEPLTVELGPGLLGSVYDSLQRPIEKIAYSFENKNIETLLPLDSEKEWIFEPCAACGDEVSFGDVLGVVDETSLLKHKICVPFGIKGTLSEISAGKFKLFDTVAVITDNTGESHQITLSQKRSIRKKYPIKNSICADEQLVTGQRAVDTFYPIIKGTANAVCAGHASGKTKLCTQIAKMSKAGVIVYLNCGERGNDLARTLSEFSSFKDEKTGESISQKTVFIASTADMPVFSRLCSIYTASTIARYYADMGLDVLLVADSLSRFFGAVSQMNELLGEILDSDAEVARLSSLLAHFFEHAGKIQPLGKGKSEATLSILATLSIEDEPLNKAIKPFINSFIFLDSDLSQKRFYPAVNTQESYCSFLSKYPSFLDEKTDEEISSLSSKLLLALSKEEEISDMISFVGIDEVDNLDRLTLFVAQLVKTAFIKQSAFDEDDLFTSFDKQALMLKLISFYYDEAEKAINNGAQTEKVLSISAIDKIDNFKYIPEENALEKAQEIKEEISFEFEQMLKKEEK